jgi:hypothetical protein
MRAVDPGSDFTPEETVYLSLTIKGRPQAGEVAARFYWHDDLVAEAAVDLADVNSGVIFSLGESTYVGYTLTHDEPFPISQAYRADVFYKDEFVESYAFRVVAPAEAMPSGVSEVTLARGSSEDYSAIDPTTTFGPTEEVFIVGRGDFGLATWLQAEWYVAGERNEDATRSITMEEDASDTGFYFSFVPDNGWPLGEHAVVLIMNDEEVGRYDFTIEEAAEVSLVSFEDPEGVFSLSYPPDFDQVQEDRAQGYSYTFAASDGSGAISLFFDTVGEPLADSDWQTFVEAFNLADLPGFGDDVVELDRQLGEPGVHALYLEVESEQNDLHGLVWVEEVEGAIAVAVLAAPIEQWPERQPALTEALDSFTWSPQAALATVTKSDISAPTPTRPAAPPPPTPTSAPSSEIPSDWFPPSGKASIVLVNEAGADLVFTMGNQEHKLVAHTQKVVFYDPGKYTYTASDPRFDSFNAECVLAADAVYYWYTDDSSWGSCFQIWP